MEKVECVGTESNITGCSIFVGSSCLLHQQVVGVRCHRDTQSLCAANEYTHGHACYKLVSQEPGTREQARALCEKDGGNLLHIYTQVIQYIYCTLTSAVSLLWGRLLILFELIEM